MTEELIEFARALESLWVTGRRDEVVRIVARKFDVPESEVSQIIYLMVRKKAGI